MARKISNLFLKELALQSLKPILEYVKSDDSLNMELRGDSVTLYYRGANLLTIIDNPFKLNGITPNYHKGYELILPTINKIEDYIPKAKRVIDRYVVGEKNHLWEKEIQQRIVQENNYSQNSLSTDFFIIDIEYQDNSIGRFDIVAIRWDSTTPARKLTKKHPLKITIFEIKQGCNSISGKSGMSQHLQDFNSLIENKIKVEKFKKDMIDVFEQKRKLGLIRDVEKYREIEIKFVENDIDFVFLLANYHSKSEKLEKELELIPDYCKFIYANSMGYGLYAKNIIDKQEFIKRFL